MEDSEGSLRYCCLCTLPTLPSDLSPCIRTCCLTARQLGYDQQKLSSTSFKWKGSSQEGNRHSVCWSQQNLHNAEMSNSTLSPKHHNHSQKANQVCVSLQPLFFVPRRHTSLQWEHWLWFLLCSSVRRSGRCTPGCSGTCSAVPWGVVSLWHPGWKGGSRQQQGT